MGNNGNQGDQAMMSEEGAEIALQLVESFISNIEVSTSMEPANVVDGLFAIARAIEGLSKAVNKLVDR
jgi:hypothetical protein